MFTGRSGHKNELSTYSFSVEFSRGQDGFCVFCKFSMHSPSPQVSEGKFCKVYMAVTYIAVWL